MPRPRTPRLWPLIALFALSAGAPTLVSSQADAEWPPPESATPKDLMDPKYWPNDPGYGFKPDDDGQWNFYSFMPPAAEGITRRPQETASGMSIDMAWRYTIGDPSVRIVVTDSGIEWDSDEIIEKAWLNAKELASHKPLHADGSACAGDGDLAGFDCNGDGVLSVSDYKDTPGLQPPASDGHPLGDKNRNGKLDAGDLILNFSDGIDDDQNGYVDDISGWDFMKNDNDPYDDTRYGHGTGEANDSTRSTNDGKGDAGVCPLCRFIPARVGDSFITDVTAFGEAVIYAADMQANIVQCALGTINNNEFSQKALDYAYAKGVLTITSMADENSRHHNMPAASNHTLPVHAIQYNGGNARSSQSFLNFHNCSNYGGQNLLSASGNSCSSEATGRLSGIAGLVYAAAKKYAITPPLTPAEAQSIFFMTADDIDVPESKEPDSSYRFSQPGFDQRFGYGRVDANAAVEAVKAKKIPPQVDITSPTWFSVLYKDQVSGPIDIQGTVAAPRANSYDYVVEWGPGVQPLDAEFKAIKSEKNVNVPVGTNGPLASLDIRTIDPTHPRDPDSPNGENDTAITVRVRAVAHYGNEIGDVKGEMRRTYYVQSDPTLVKGFPIYVGNSGESSPKMADIDGDGVRDLVYPTGGGVLHVLRVGPNGPEPLAGFPFRANRLDAFAETPVPKGMKNHLGAPAYASKAVDADVAREAFTQAPGIADLDGDGKPEIVVSTWTGTIYVVERDGSLRKGWPVRLPEVPSCPLDKDPDPETPCMSETTRIARGAFAAPVLVDLDKDGKLDIVQSAFDGKIYAFDASGKPLDGWPVTLHWKGSPVWPKAASTNRIMATPAVADFNGDGVPDLVVGSSERLAEGGQAGAVYLVDGRGNKAPNGPVLPNWPVSMTSFYLFPLVAEGVPNSPAIARFDGTLAAVSHGNATLPLILPADPGPQSQLSQTPPNAIPAHDDPNEPGSTVRGVYPASMFGPLSTAAQPNTMLPLFAQPSVGDLDQDGVPDVIATGGSLNLAINLKSKSGSALQGDHLIAAWSGKTGAMMPGMPVVLEDYTFFNNQAIVDVNGDGYPEIVTGSGGYFLHAVDACGREAAGFPKFTGQWIIPTAAFGDLDGDGTLEVSVGTRDGWLYAWHTPAKASEATVEWESFHHDNRNTGNLETPLEQGGHKKAAKPLTVDLCTAVPTTSTPLEPDGGCSCEVPGTKRDERGLAGLAAAALAAFATLRRRRRS
jgi:MYXO-CTERM domain-containing protein